MRLTVIRFACDPIVISIHLRSISGLVAVYRCLSSRASVVATRKIVAQLWLTVPANVTRRLDSRSDQPRYAIVKKSYSKNGYAS